MVKLKAKEILFSVCFFLGITSSVCALDLEKAKIYFLSGDYKSAIAEGEKLLSNYGRTSQSDELYYILGLSYLKDGNYLRASDIFEIILAEFKDSKFKEEAKLGLADTYLLRGDLNKAQDYYEELLNTSNAGLKARLYYRLSQVGFKKGDTAQGQEYLDKLKKDFPANPELRLNKDLSAFSDSPSGFYYTVQVGSFSNSANAKNLMQALIQKGYSAYIEETNSGSAPSYRVRVGKLSSRQEAVNLENKLSQEGYPTKVCP